MSKRKWDRVMDQLFAVMYGRMFSHERERELHSLVFHDAPDGLTAAQLVRAWWKHMTPEEKKDAKERCGKVEVLETLLRLRLEGHRLTPEIQDDFKRAMEKAPRLWVKIQKALREEAEGN